MNRLSKRSKAKKATELDLAKQKLPTERRKLSLNKYLNRAAIHKDKLEIRKLLKDGADVNARDSNGVTALIIAARWGRDDICSLLISKGADVNAKTDHGMTPLMAAAYYGHTQTCAFLLEKGADMNEISKNGRNAFMYAVWADKKETAEFLRNYLPNLLKSILGEEGAVRFFSVFDECIQ
jgi:ankyrin repeat protein